VPGQLDVPLIRVQELKEPLTVSELSHLLFEKALISGVNRFK
jgi:hypothetical protein